jgi:type II secretory pathway pseudopilin PulG
MGGPGVDPNYNGSAAEASAWGARQAARALADAAGENVTYPVLFMDIEIPGVAPASDNGWNSVYTSPCSGVVKHSGVPAAVDRADFNGFWGYVKAHSKYAPGVYSSAGIWASIFGTGSAASIPHTDEWTYEPETANLSDAPVGWCLKSGGGCAQFFGGVTSGSSNALMWQWSGGGGVRNALGDFDQIDGSRQS